MPKRAPSPADGRCTSVMSHSDPNPLIVRGEGAMKNIQEVLREKENEIEKLTREIKLLRVAARILEDESQAQSPRAIDPMPRHADAPATTAAEPLLEVLPSGEPTNGEFSKRWP
jgi:hypothetical protein